MDIYEIRRFNTHSLIETNDYESLTDFAKAYGVSQSYINKILGNNPTKNIGEKVARKLEIFFKEPKGSLDVSPLEGFEPIEETTTKLPGTQKPQNTSTIPEQSVIAIDDGKDHSETHCRVQRFDVTLSAGAGTAQWVMREKDDDPIWFRKGWFKAKRLNPAVLKAMYVRGDSMEDYLFHYDTVFIDITDTEINDGDVYAIVFKDKFYVKELQNWDGEVKIISRNDKYPPMYTDSDEVDRYNNYFQVLGRVAWRGG